MRPQQFRHYSFGIVSLVLFCTPLFVFGQEIGGVYRFFGIHTASIALLVMRILQIVWIIITVGCLGVVGYALYMLRSAQGDIGREVSAKSILKYSGIALGVSLVITIVLSVLLVRMNRPPQDTGGATQTPASQQFGFAPGPSLLGALSKITSHYPARDEKNVSRNAQIMITVGQAIDGGSVRDGEGRLKSDVIVINRAGSRDAGLAAHVEVSADGKTLIISPDELLGVAGGVMDYRVEVTPRVKLADGRDFFEGGTGYTWQFQTGGTVDTTPPTIESVFPDPAGGAVARNATVIITFSEAIHPSVLSEGRIEITQGDARTKVTGALRQGNDYRTVSFIPDASCGKNACGNTVMCFAADAKFAVTVRAATPAGVSGESATRAKVPYDGVVDMAGNALKDSYAMTFSTSRDTMIAPPVIRAMTPSRDAVNVDKTTPVSITFSQLMDPTTLHHSSIILGEDLNYSVQTTSDMKAGSTTVRITHDPFKDNTLYTPFVTSDVRDVFQNCFAPCSGPLQ